MCLLCVRDGVFEAVISVGGGEAAQRLVQRRPLHVQIRQRRICNKQQQTTSRCCQQMSAASRHMQVGTESEHWQRTDW